MRLAVNWIMVALFSLKYNKKTPSTTQPAHSVKKMFNASSNYSLHAKIYMIDRRDLVMGSLNFDPRSLRLNTGQVLVIHSAALCEQITMLFERFTRPEASYHVTLATALPVPLQPDDKDALVWITQENGQNVYYDFNPHAGFWRHVLDSMFSVLPIESFL